ncbi:MAG: hypothetical protein ACM3ZA_00990 [Bacillota bacterium]
MEIKVGGATVAIIEGSLSIDDAIAERSTAAFVVRDAAGASHYQKGQPVEVRDDANTLIFAGVIDSAQEQQPTPGLLLLHTIRCADWHYLADKRIAAKAWENTLAGAIVQDLISSYLAAEGVTAGTIQDGPIIREAVVNYAPVTEALDGVAEKAGCIWWIDPAKRLHFVERATYAAPWAATGADMRQGSVSVESANPKYRNRQYIKGGRDITDPQTETRKGDGNTRSFALGFPIAKVPTVTVNGAAQTVGIKGVDTGKQWYWSKGDPVLTQDQSLTPLATTDTLSVTYQGEYDIIVLSEDNAEIIGRQQIEGGGTGYVEDVADEPQTSNRDAAFQSANAKLRQYARIGRRLRFRTRRPGLAPGQLLTVTLPEHALDGTEMLIESVSISDEADILWYDVLAVEGPEQGSWSRMFRAMATRGQAFVERVNIGEDKVLIILQTFNEAWPWGEAVTPQVFACPIPSVNLYPSVNLLPC